MLKKVFHFLFVKAFHYFMFMNATNHSNDVPNVSAISYNRCCSFYVLSAPTSHGNVHMQPSW